MGWIGGKSPQILNLCTAGSECLASRSSCFMLMVSAPIPIGTETVSDMEKKDILTRNQTPVVELLPLQGLIKSNSL
jgi:hypothetical protein